MFYELKHPLNADYCKIEGGENFSFSPHIHHCFEIILITGGQMEIRIDDKFYRLKKGEAVIIFPNQIHSLRTMTESRHILCVFSQKLINSYAKKVQGRVPHENAFTPPSFLAEELRRLFDEKNDIVVKGVLYSLCGCFDTAASYRDASAPRSDTLLFKIFEYIEANYKGDCSLKDLAAHTAYDYAYLSKFFKKSVGIPYNDYVNHYRVSEACYLLRSSEMTILQISEECGYDSLRSLNRNFKERVQLSPAGYRKQYKNEAG